jgi:hypothetical protein
MRDRGGLDPEGGEKRRAEVLWANGGTYGKSRSVRFGPRNLTPVSPADPEEMTFVEIAEGDGSSTGVGSSGCLAQ